MEVRHWFDTREGKLVVGDPAYDEAVQFSAVGDIVPLADLITQTEMAVDTSSYDSLPYQRNRPHEEIRAYGSWVLKVLEEATEPTELARYQFNNLSKLGLGPGSKAVRNALGPTIWEVAESLGAEKQYAPTGSFDSWDVYEFLENAEQLAKELSLTRHPKPKETDYAEWARQGRGPSPAIIEARTGLNVSQLNELIGFPNIKDWEREDYVNWGVEVMKANDGQPVIRSIITILANRKRGPGASAIVRKFGGLREFQDIISSRYAAPQHDLQSDDQRLHQHVELLTAHFASEGIENPENILGLAARFEVARRLVKGLKNSEVAAIAYETDSTTFIDRLIDENYYLDARQIRRLAMDLGINDLIWPRARHNQEHLRVGHDELAEVRAKYALYSRGQKRAQRLREAS